MKTTRIKVEQPPVQKGLKRYELKVECSGGSLEPGLYASPRGDWVNGKALDDEIALAVTRLEAIECVSSEDEKEGRTDRDEVNIRAKQQADKVICDFLMAVAPAVRDAEWAVYQRCGGIWVPGGGDSG